MIRSQWPSHNSVTESTVISTSSSLLFSRAFAMDCAASTPMVFPSSLRARRPWNSSMARLISATVERHARVWNGVPMPTQLTLFIEVMPSRKTNILYFVLLFNIIRTWFCIIQFKALSLVTQFSITHMCFGQSLCQLGYIHGRHSVSNLWHAT